MKQFNTRFFICAAALLAIGIGACTSSTPSSNGGFQALQPSIDKNVSYKDILARDLNTSDYTKWLENDYKGLAVFEYANMYDYRDGDHFANKSIEAGRGVVVAPDAPSSREIDIKYQEEATMAYNIVLDSYKQRKDKAYPPEMARLQVSYDCWLEQIEEGWQTDHIMKCRDMFFDALANMKGLEFSVAVYFENDSFEITPREAQKLNALVQNYQIRRQNITIEGHTDSRGTQAYNQNLSEERANVVAQYLNRALAASPAGLSRDTLIQTKGYGEMHLAIPTGDEVSEPRNRRAIVHFR